LSYFPESPSERNGVLSTVVLTWLPGTCTGTGVQACDGGCISENNEAAH
jgi:hypothetical protein